MKILLTGASRGLGSGLLEYAISNDYETITLGLTNPQKSNRHIHCDLSKLDQAEEIIKEDLIDKSFDIVFLNAGILGPLDKIQNTTIKSLESVMEVNLWANKIILDQLLSIEAKVKQIVLISSGASVSGGRGWAGYSLSKAAANMLMQLYAHEFTGAHLVALAPGLIESEMQEQIRETKFGEEFPVFKRLKKAKDTADMQSPLEAARKIFGVLDKVRELPSGSFADIRKI